MDENKELNEKELEEVDGGEDFWKSIKKAYKKVSDFVVPETGKPDLTWMPDPFDYNRDKDI